MVESIFKLRFHTFLLFSHNFFRDANHFPWEALMIHRCTKFEIDQFFKARSWNESFENSSEAVDSPMMMRLFLFCENKFCSNCQPLKLTLRRESHSKLQSMDWINYYCNDNPCANKAFVVTCIITRLQNQLYQLWHPKLSDYHLNTTFKLSSTVAYLQFYILQNACKLRHYLWIFIDFCVYGTIVQNV